MADSTVLFRARVPEKRLKHAERVLARLGLKPGDAFNMLLAQIELRQAIPYPVTTQSVQLLSADEQASTWTKALGEY